MLVQIMETVKMSGLVHVVSHAHVNVKLLGGGVGGCPEA